LQFLQFLQFLQLFLQFLPFKFPNLVTRFIKERFLLIYESWFK
jgi:hypothetical protein